ncbi:NADH-quinone oxidoreductase subunit C [Komagataeibacter nataicola]|uniref:NADH-quinone oxidoreductase subunit C n=1 Tax=Komagataeibacter nataicola TaxID=265960 RepID=A0A9N7H194_9PROT|nr:NADH-quinone oxidoreductase subunit C [Komagataeibacter nataicola]AQU86775.1 NADH-quinone oxidoreductase subunit C [Komagataeibacter nataicola]PYD67794.1 NADH-quinone oxidoreductase subunit C [Komagataeibacter nataicola]WEQ56277.1 NADH-quinone oxidoreductase subunit C [Komagataeibacter nataicola]WNM07854.1 NADH-quinone oxidoreductase subunit C [Komagataeibacter nataicola]GBR24528.1 NADH-quinone oxidoreductase chain C [Komagataeibacter nataicola NRIC 0616]
MADVQNLPATAPRGVTGSLGAISFRLSTTVPGIMSAGIEKGELVVRTTRDRLLPLMAMLRDDPLYACQQVMDICGVDFPDRPERFEVVYNLLSVTHNHRIRVIVTTDETHPVPSVHQLWPAATWWEREAYDLFGILFTDQPDLRRILTDYGFEGHPLRKDFPLTGYVEMRYDEERRQVVYEPVDLVQDFRNFDFESPWEGILTLPGDEKAHADRHDIKRKG